MYPSRKALNHFAITSQFVVPLTLVHVSSFSVGSKGMEEYALPFDHSRDNKLKVFSRLSTAIRVLGLDNVLELHGFNDCVLPLANSRCT